MQIEVVLLTSVALALGIFFGRLWAERKIKCINEQFLSANMEVGRLNYTIGALQNENDRLNTVYVNLEKQFNSLADNILKSNSQLFLNNARDLIEGYQKQAELSFSNKQEQINQILMPMESKIKDIDSQLLKFNENTKTEFKMSIDNLLQVSRETAEKAHNLTLTLTNNNKKAGNWGELHLENLLSNELKLREGLDYIKQAQSGSGRPDFILNLPEGRKIVIDCKTPMKYYYDGVNNEDDIKRKADFKDLATSIRTQISILSGKNYSKDHTTFDCVVVYLPIDMMLVYALESDKDLLLYAFEKRVILATPITIFPLLTTLKYMWDNYNIVRNSTEIIGVVKDIYRSIGELGGALGKAGEYLTDAQTLFNTQLVDKTNILKNLGVAVEYKVHKTAKTKTDIISEI